MTLVWFLLADDRLYYCSDSVWLSDLIPPFVHTYSDISTGDRYLVSPGIVWTLWGTCVSITLLLPAFAVRFFSSPKA
jgi:hypothetical protein